MHVTFVVIGSEQLAISQLSSIAKREGHTVGLAFNAALFDDRYNLEYKWLGKVFDESSEVKEAIKEQKPDVIAFSVLTSTYQWMLGIAQYAKSVNPNVKTVFGGVHTSAVPDRMLLQDAIDYVVVGEGDYAFASILQAIEKGDTNTPISNTRFKDENSNIIRGVQEGFIQDLDDLPPFDKSIWEDHIRIGDNYMTMASRGCPYRCSFCFNNFFAKLPDGKRGKYVRTRSVDHIIHELKIAKKRYNLKRIDFLDDVFTVYKPWLKELMIRYKKEINIPFQCLTHPHYMDDEVAGWLHEAGCDWVIMGVQSMDEGFKFNNLNRYEESSKVEDALTAMTSKGIMVKVDHMLGLPEEPPEAQEAARKLYVQGGPSRIQTYWTCFLPGTDLMNKAVAEKWISQEQAERLYDGVDFYFFRNEDNIKDMDLVKHYRSYEFLFRLLPLIPQSLKAKIDPKKLRNLPPTIMRSIVMIADIITGIYRGNPELVAYAKHYLFHLYRILRKKIGLKAPKATEARCEESIHDKYLTEPKKEQIVA